MVMKAIAAMALYTTATRAGQSKNQIVDDLNEFSLQELLEFREKILEQKQSIESQVADGVESEVENGEEQESD